MTIEKTVSGKNAELRLKGWMDTQNAEVLAAAVEELDPETESLVLDLSELEYTSSAGIRQLVATHLRMKGAMTLKHVSAEIMDVLHMAGLDAYRTVKTGLKSCRQSGRTRERRRTNREEAFNQPVDYPELRGRFSLFNGYCLHCQLSGKPQGGF